MADPEPETGLVSALMRPIEALGAVLIGLVNAVGHYMFFCGRALAGIFRRPLRIRLLFKQMEFVGVQSLAIVIITGLFTGMVFCFQSESAFSRFGASTMVGGVVMISLTRELGPVLTALMVNGRVGSAMAAELGTMRVSEQIDALESMAVDPYQYLVTPRIVAATLMVPALTAVFEYIGAFGTWYVGVKMLSINQGPFLARMEWFVDPDDIWGGLLKSAAFGFILSSVGCYRGFHAQGGAEGVGKATTAAVVIAGVGILVSDYFMTLVIVPLGESL